MTISYSTQPAVFGFTIDGYTNAAPSTSNDGAVTYGTGFKNIVIDSSGTQYGQSNILNMAGQRFMFNSNHTIYQQNYMVDDNGTYYRVENAERAIMTMNFTKPDNTSYTLSNVTTHALTLQPVDQFGAEIVGSQTMTVYLPLTSYSSHIAFTSYTLMSVNTTSSGQYVDNYAMPAMSSTQIALSTASCLVAGTRILTTKGNLPIENLKTGDLVWTRNNGFKPICWIGSTTVCGLGKNAPITIVKHIGEQTSRLRLSPLHRVLLEGWCAKTLFNKNSVLVAAKHLLSGDNVFIEPQQTVEYYHIMFETHEIILAENQLVESLFVGDETSVNHSKIDFSELREFFPELFKNYRMDTLCYQELTKAEGSVLASFML